MGKPAAELRSGLTGEKRPFPPCSQGVASRMAVPCTLCHHAIVPSVLIVDDHPSFRASARAILEADGFEVAGEAEDGESAIAAAGRLHPDIVLLDVQLPDLDGFEVTRRLIANDGDTCVVLVSSRDGADFGPLVETSGACGFVPKSELSGEAVTALLCAR
jgi:DNA-binding NarL/FixJ family response regulator